MRWSRAQMFSLLCGAASGAQGGICLILLDLDLVSLSPEAP